MLVESVLHPARSMNGVGRFIRRADQIAGDCVSGSCTRRQRPEATRQAARAEQRISAEASCKAARSGRKVRVVDILKCSRPSVLREIVVVDAEAGANYGLPAGAGRVSDPEARRDLLAIVTRYARHNRNLQRLQRHICGVIGFASARTRE